MERSLRLVQLTLRITALLQIVGGAVIWSGHGAALVNAHAGVGLLFVLALWGLAALGTRARVGPGLVIRAAAWGIIVLWLGMVQTRMWPGPPHVYVRVLHLIVGLAAIGLGEALGARIRRRLADAAQLAATY